MSDKNQGLIKKYEVTKLSNPSKVVDAVVLEFDDEIARRAIFQWAKHMGFEGYKQVHDDTIKKLNEYTGNRGLYF